MTTLIYIFLDGKLVSLRYRTGAVTTFGLLYDSRERL